MARKRKHAQKDRKLAALVDEFAAKVLNAYPDRARMRPKALKDRAVKLIRYRLPPLPNPPGQPRKAHITKALRAYERQLREVELGKRDRVNWQPIASECSAEYREARTQAERSLALRRLRNSVYERRGRPRSRRGRRGKQSHSR